MRKKILWISQLIMAVVLLIYALLSTQVFYDNLITASQNELKIYMNLFDEGDFSLDQAGADGFSGQLSGLRVTFMDTEGNVLADSSKEELGNHSDREEVREALASGEGYSVRRSSSLGEDMIYYCRLFSPEGEAAYLVRIAIPTSSEWQVFRDTLPTLAWFLLLDFLVCLLFTYIETEYIISPVRRLAKDAALNLRLSTRYPELQPIVDVLNKRNSEVSEQFRELSEEKDLVEKAQRSKNDFIANVTHEMNTPLTSIRGYSELIAGGALNEEQTKAAANTLVKQSDRLSKLIACIINYNEIDNDELPAYEVDLSKLAEEILEVLAPDIEKRNIALEKHIEPGISVMSRHERLNEVLGNLIRNAIRYNKEGGNLRVGICRTEDGHPRLTVSDTGIGIAEENLERIFDRFFTVDKSHSGKNGGFGLGLAVVKKICRRSGWGLRVESCLGEGTTFTVDFA
ncbi:MAG TPA: hypothetical protein IAB32_03560 [Candidatus Scatosoma pullicola]|nr:hypothetical protein [Candidatus Scatosoma pullicola]